MLNSWPLAKDLQVLVEIVHSGSFSAAAATLGQTPHLSQADQILENTLATTLLNRSARGVALTEVANVVTNMRWKSSPNISDWLMTSRKSKRARRG